MPAAFFLMIAAALFVVGVLMLLTRRNVLMALIGIELMLNAANINFVVFAKGDPDGQIFALFAITFAAVETALALAMIIQIYRKFGTVQVDELAQLKD